MKTMLNLIGWLFVIASFTVAGWMILSYIDIVSHNLTTQCYSPFNFWIMISREALKIWQ